MTDIFSWQHVNYLVSIPGENDRKLLSDVSGYVAPGKLTALMGESGAGKTTLLNVLAQRTSAGVVTGDMFVNGQALPADFQSQTCVFLLCPPSYFYLSFLVAIVSKWTPTCRLQLSVRHYYSLQNFDSQRLYLWQRKKHSKIFHLVTLCTGLTCESVEKCLKMCGLEAYGEASVGSLGIEHRKRTTIAVELAAKVSILKTHSNTSPYRESSPNFFCFWTSQHPG